MEPLTSFIPLNNDGSSPHDNAALQQQLEMERTEYAMLQRKLTSTEKQRDSAMKEERNAESDVRRAEAEKRVRIEALTKR